MKEERFYEVINARIDKCKAVLIRKADEYATDDRLHNFKVAAELQGCTPMTALAGMMAKHTVSVYDLIRDHERGVINLREIWDEKIGDSLNDLLLLTALLDEENDESRESGLYIEVCDNESKKSKEDEKEEMLQKKDRVMRYEEAIRAIKKNKPTSGYIVLREALDMAVEALERQIPKKPEYYDNFCAKCPNCDNDDFEEGINNWGCGYCPDCGQKLDWSDTEQCEE